MEKQNENFEKIIVDLLDNKGNERKVSFMGEWLIQNEREDVDGMIVGIEYSLAITWKGKFFLLSKKSGCNAFAVYDVFDSFKELVENIVLPGILSMVANEIGEEYIEKLDI
jgi:hypothetical protein